MSKTRVPYIQQEVRVLFQLTHWDDDELWVTGSIWIDGVELSDAFQVAVPRNWTWQDFRTVIEPLTARVSEHMMSYRLDRPTWIRDRHQAEEGGALELF